MEVLTIVEVVTQIVTYLMFASGIPPCLHMYRTKSTKNVPFTFFALGVVNGFTGLLYGYLSNLPPLIYVNAVGLTLNCIYVLTYLAVCQSKGSTIAQLVSLCSPLVLYYKYITSQGNSEPVVLDQLGAFMFFVTVCLMLSTFLEVIQCVQEKSVDGLSRSMLYVGLSCCLCWLIYGFMLEDFYIYAPNVIGIAASIWKIFLIFIYGGKSKKID
ncbi:sugar transporter SWEET1-like [Mizuhopecten yessoensis]|uniref:Sugar transporter SWEET1 n=1 Tax=Mizuhopecten yessoensis TaxID=6573 RepID=A0A210QE04_MIZYE|nr:sugar transporter SWEET1-like [Mizuhopecten yessoensis]OWF46949.1 Sugar transporter SWEET1 [Mizuhopecten yessoensis]